MKKFSIIVFFLASILTSVVAYSHLDTDLTDEDIYYAWVEGTRIVNGENPYSRIHEGNMRDNDKYSTYFPLFYEASALAIVMGLDEFSEWIGLWRFVFLACNLGIGLIIFSMYFKRGWYSLGLLASSLWLFSRWALYVSQVVHLDSFAIFFLVLALFLYDKNQDASLISLGLSLAIKQIAVFLVPLFLIWRAGESKSTLGQSFLRSLAIIFAVPIISSIPFLISDASGFVKSILFSLTRVAADHFRAGGLSVYLELSGIYERIPLLLAIMAIVWLSARNQVPKYLAAFLVMIAFVELNPVLVAQYLAWPMALLPFVIYEQNESLMTMRTKQGNI